MSGERFTPLARGAASEVLLKIYVKFFDAHKHLKRSLS